MKNFRFLSRDECGSILIQFTITIVAIMGMIGLALDGGRFVLLNNGLQDLADAVALAGVAKLDGTANALTNAEAAARDLGSDNNVHWAKNAKNFPANVPVGRMVRLVNGANAPGNWGLLEPPSGANPQIRRGQEGAKRVT